MIIKVKWTFLLTFICGIGNSSKDQALYLPQSILPETEVETNLVIEDLLKVIYV